MTEYCSDIAFTTGNKGITELGIISLSMAVGRRRNNHDFYFGCDQEDLSDEIRECICKWNVFTMGIHRRLGEESAVKVLYLDVLEIILRYLINRKK